MAESNIVTDWVVFEPYFSKEEFDCSFTGENQMLEEFMTRLFELRVSLGFPFVITSGYRSPTHPVEARKASPGTHAQGIACDIQITNGYDAGRLIQEALKMGFKGIGVAQDADRPRDARFIHLDLRDSPFPIVWSY
jgi:uncharacterized protein YcbK (DUF882 family)